VSGGIGHLLLLADRELPGTGGLAYYVREVARVGFIQFNPDIEPPLLSTHENL
jgi:hypothetical protein